MNLQMSFGDAEIHSDIQGSTSVSSLHPPPPRPHNLPFLFGFCWFFLFFGFFFLKPACSSPYSVLAAKAPSCYQLSSLIILTKLDTWSQQNFKALTELALE